MELFTISSSIIVTCSNRLSSYLGQEISELGYIPTRVFKTGVELQGTINDCIRLNLHLRCASQVLYSIKKFRAQHANDLYQYALTLEWERFFTETEYFSITSNISNPTITNNLFANVRLKDAIVDRFRERTGRRPDSGPGLSGVVIHLYWKEDEAELFLDTSGETLSKHGYRKIPGKAPMLESLAAATLLATKWNRRSNFINPMCGSGTLAIEAAMLATNRKPGLYRDNYAFMHISGFDETFYRNEMNYIREKVISTLPCKIIATDNRQDAINISTINAGAAGVEQLISFEVCDFLDTEIPEQNKGVIIFNPEYGDRMGEEEELAQTYKSLGDFLKTKCKGYTGYIFTGNLELAKKIGLRPSRRIEFFTGQIDCRLLEYELYEGSRETKTIA
jgi:23S rRNA G2445 N2-methylase RlmL